ncbi:MAG TPA: bifunctional adenosylcobinamide kinase/adenosylcobinamide-phosphate guanylyltransferase [Acidimicrobiales bacterium]|nr:bifunctional adenosylcobinamide kinase/adenosylcobinamide-phosphate guanylyltransferase [Acidimicrobiales bacterium]
MITLVLGGARSGKSAVAERLAARLAPPVTYVATLAVRDDADLARRVEVHRRRRPPSWDTVEVAPGEPGELGAVLRTLTGSVLVDSLGPWVAGTGPGPVDDDGLCAALRARRGDTVVVSEEVGLSVHPSSEAGRHFRDALGSVNQAVARCADHVLLVVAGRVLALAAVEDGPGGPGGGW